MFLYTLFIAGLLGASADLIENSKAPEWDGLKVRWGPTMSDDFFHSMPRKVDDAVEQGFVKISDCDASKNASFRGQRYLNDSDDAVILIYDIKGFIAGIQIAIPSGLTKTYPSKHITPPYVKVDDKYYLTAYFVHPNTICTKGRTPLEFHTEGTASSLLIQNGTNPDADFFELPRDEKDMKSTKWVQGLCLGTMGMHYWYDISKDMDCDKFVPVFALYANKRLRGFGWTVGGNLNSPIVEHPPTYTYPLLFKEPPTCIYHEGTGNSSLHIYLSNDIAANTC